jgi:hypothetical protein
MPASIPAVRLHQAFLTPHPDETLLTIRWRWRRGSREIVVRAVQDVLDGNLQTMTSDLPSVQRFHPPIWTYLATGLPGASGSFPRSRFDPGHDRKYLHHRAGRF